MAPRAATLSKPTATTPNATPKAGGKPVHSRRKRHATDVDTHVGGRIRLRRTLLGMSQEKLGDMIGLTFQQVQKYERGANRVSAGTLHDLSRVLDVPVSFFFDDMPEESANPVIAQDDSRMANQRRKLELNRQFERITNPELQQRLLELMRSMADSEEATALAQAEAQVKAEAAKVSAKPVPKKATVHRSPRAA